MNSPGSPYVKVTVTMEFLVSRGTGRTGLVGSLKLEDHATITQALANAMPMRLPEGYVHVGTHVELEDA